MMLDIYNHYCCSNSSEFPVVARFLTIYIEEAHAHDEWWLPESPGAHVGGGSYIANHRHIQDRMGAAKRFVDDFGFPGEVVCDSFQDEVNDRYGAWPERLYIIEQGVVVYKGGIGPFDYRLAEVKDWLIARYGLRGEVMTRR